MYKREVLPEPSQIQQLLPSPGDAPAHHVTLNWAEGSPLSVVASLALGPLLAGLARSVRASSACRESRLVRSIQLHPKGILPM